jgi:hypothetical protein
MAFADALRALNELKAAGVIDEYAIAGAMALVFWTEPVPTFDLDVLVLPPPPGGLVSLDPLYRWAETHGYASEDEHILVEGLPTQFVPAPDQTSSSGMGSRSDLRAAQPPEALLQRLWKGKAALHQRHASLPLPEKVRLVMELQRIVLPLLARQRPLRSWERPWQFAP